MWQKIGLIKFSKPKIIEGDKELGLNGECDFVISQGNGYILATLRGTSGLVSIMDCTGVRKLPLIENATWGAFDQNGKEIFPFQYGQLSPDGDYIRVMRGKFMGLYNVPKKEFTLPLAYEFIGRFDEEGKAVWCAEKKQVT